MSFTQYQPNLTQWTWRVESHITFYKTVLKSIKSAFLAGAPPDIRELMLSQINMEVPLKYDVKKKSSVKFCETGDVKFNILTHLPGKV